MKKLKTPEVLLRRTLTARKIRTFDERADRQSAYQNSDLARGFFISTIDDLLETPGLTKRLRTSPLRQKPSAGTRAYYTWDIQDFLWDALLGSKKLNELVVDYLGPNVRLDDVYVKTIKDGHQSVSEGWHNDNVGYRLKLFMVFDTEGQPSGTILIPRIRPYLYRVNYGEELGRLFSKPSMHSREDEVSVEYRPGDCLLFDTNIPHRGNYSAGEGIRYCVMAEFIDREKADHIIGKAPCGPGGGKKKIRIPETLKNDPEKHPLIDSTLLSRTGGGYEYGYER